MADNNSVKGDVQLTYVEGDRGCVLAINMDSKKVVWSGKFHDYNIIDMAVGKDVLLTGSMDWTLCVIEKVAGKVRHHLEGHKGTVESVAMSGDLAVSGSSDGTFKVWNVITGKCVRTINDEKYGCYPVQSVDIRGKLMVIARQCGVVQVYTWPELKEVAEFWPCGNHRMGKIVILPNDRVASCCHHGNWETGCVNIWNIKTNTKLYTMRKDSQAYAIAYLGNGNVASGHNIGKINIWNPKTGKHVLSMSHGHDGIDTDEWDFDKPICEYDGHVSMIYSMCDNGNGTLTSTSLDGTIRIFNIDTGELVLTKADVTSLCVAVDRCQGISD